MKAKTNRIQYFFMIPNILYAKAIGITSGVTVRAVGGDVWLSMTIGFLIGTVFVVLLTFLGNKFPEKTIIEYGGELFGKWFAKLLGIILIAYFGVAFAVAINVMSLHLKEYFLPTTPFLILSAIFIILCAYGVFLGVEVIIRFSFYGFAMTWLINITMILGTIADFEFVNLLPLFDRGIVKDTIASVYSFCDATMVILAVGIIFPMLDNKKKSVLLSTTAMAVSTVMVVIWPFFEVGVLGADVMKQFVVVCMQQVRSAQLTRYLPRYELIMVSFFVWGLTVQCTVMLHCCQYSIKQVFSIKSNKKILIVITPILIFLADYIGRDHNRYVHFLHYPWSQISTALGIGVPLLLLGGAAARGKLHGHKK